MPTLKLVIFSERFIRCARRVCTAMLGFGLFYGAAGERLLPDLPRSVEPIVGRDWDKAETEYAVDPVAADTVMPEAGGDTANSVMPPQNRNLSAHLRAPWAYAHYQPRRFAAPPL